jgi:hypothetical protein
VPERFIIDPVEIDNIPEQHPVSVFSRKWAKFPKKNGAALWHSFSPATCADVLPWASVIERTVVEGKTTHIIRLQGTEIEKMAGLNTQGAALEDVLAEAALEERLRELNHIITSPGYFLSKTVIPFEGRDFIEVYRGAFAFTKDEVNVDRIVMIIGPENIML